MVELGAFGLGGTEVLILIMAALFLFFGGKKLPELAKGLGRAMGEFQRGRAEFEKEIGKGLDEKDGNAGPSKTPAAPPKPGALEVELRGPDDDGIRDSKVVLAARALGIETGGKTEEELKKEIAALVGNQPRNDAIK